MIILDPTSVQNTSNSRKSLVLFGAGTFASLAAHCVTHDSKRTVLGFTVDLPYVRAETHEGLPLVAFETLPSHFPPDTHDMLLPLGYTRMNEFRQARFVGAGAVVIADTEPDGVYLGNPAHRLPDKTSLDVT